MRVPPAGRRATYSPTRATMSVAARTSAMDSSRIRPATASLISPDAALPAATLNPSLRRQRGSGGRSVARRELYAAPRTHGALRPQGGRWIASPVFRTWRAVGAGEIEVGVYWRVWQGLRMRCPPPGLRPVRYVYAPPSVEKLL